MNVLIGNLLERERKWERERMKFVRGEKGEADRKEVDLVGRRCRKR